MNDETETATIDAITSTTTYNRDDDFENQSLNNREIVLIILCSLTLAFAILGILLFINTWFKKKKLEKKLKKENENERDHTQDAVNSAPHHKGSHDNSNLNEDRRVAQVQELFVKKIPYRNFSLTNTVNLVENDMAHHQQQKRQRVFGINLKNFSLTQMNDTQKFNKNNSVHERFDYHDFNEEDEDGYNDEVENNRNEYGLTSGVANLGFYVDPSEIIVKDEKEEPEKDDEVTTTRF